MSAPLLDVVELNYALVYWGVANPTAIVASMIGRMTFKVGPAKGQPFSGYGVFETFARFGEGLNHVAILS